MHVNIRLPYRLSVRFANWTWAAVFAVAAMAVQGGKEEGLPVAGVLLGLALTGPGVMAAYTLCSARAWERFVKPDVNMARARHNLSWIVGVGIFGVAALVASFAELF